MPGRALDARVFVRALTISEARRLMSMQKGIMPEILNLYFWVVVQRTLGDLSSNSTNSRVTFIIESGLRDIEFIPCFTRNSANSG
jgi:hypothetical protein